MNKCTTLITIGLAGQILLSGCALFQGKADVQVSLVASDGRTWSVNKTDAGIDIQGEYVDSRGFIWTLGEGIGAVSVTDPRTGATVSIIPKG